jgi:UDP-N-acetylglucosamine 4,6-dehydratase
MLTSKIILITGGTGSLGHAIVELIAKKFTPRKVIIFSRDELKQYEMNEQYDFPWLRFFLGNVRDAKRVSGVMAGVDYVVHAAALKQIPAIEYSPTEGVKTNVNGTMNVIDACIANDVKKAVLISTDKAVHPVNLYGATKLTAEKLFLAANSYHKTRFSFVRYGNVINSRGSVIELFMKLKRKGVREFPITDMKMTRFWITLEDAAQLVLNALKSNAQKIIPRLPSMEMADVARAIDPGCTFKVIGVRPGEKMYEMLDEDYSSDTNDDWLSSEELREKLGISS